jgi:hypothetical protein
MNDTYLPAFEAGVKLGKASGIRFKKLRHAFQQFKTCGS